VSEHHDYLVVDFGDIDVTRLAYARRIKFAFFCLNSEVQDMLGWQGEFHPYIFPVFERFILVSRCRHTMEAKLPE